MIDSYLKGNGLKDMDRRKFMSAVAVAAPAELLANLPQSDRAKPAGMPKRITRLEAFLLQKPLKERFWMSVFPIGGMNPKASRLILKVHTDAGIVGYGEGGGGTELFRRGFADLVLGEDPFMVGKVWEKMFAITYDRELAKRDWSREGVISAMAAIDAALYDIMAKSADLPLYKFLGGYRDSVPVYVTGGYYREGKGIKELVEEILGYINQGLN